MLEALDFRPLPPRHEALRSELRTFLAERLGDYPLDLRARSWQGFDADFSRALAARGWVGLTLPREYGGAGLDPLARFVMVEELLCAGAPVAAHWIADRQSGPLLLRFGSEAQKRFHLPAICRGEQFFCIGMSEPNSGSDLASVRTRAERNATGWRLNGQKIWTTYAQHSHYMIALVRTSGSAEDRHGGLSQVIVDLSLPGVSIRPIRDLTGAEHFCEVFFDDVQLPEGALVGKEGEGWKQVTAELAFERSGPERIYSSIALLDAWMDWLRVRPQPGHERLLGQLLGELMVLRALSVSLAAQLADGRSPVVEAALVKDLGTAFEQSIPALLGDVLGAIDGAEAPHLLRRTLAYLERMAPVFSLRGGTREILRGVVARGLGLR
ncbi:alkylation response protein AidB-like acyl-CoA dehydrogenase [Pseudomonas citronellolis]|nr:acyl-CoA dehydrogenase family protein [Pseudomonas citronellolis]MCP1607472.1 alkylation response protein AidB-like acyl-CoA dehydrogenase [Pseudomonas citronellolis]MCP1658360.1 alkylation response protein AidB-like acyl-CoA dehydrogenase [Pseudomonas citronellolis]MCP1725229.1 alkylation response protein AidB-like acyl-CoA dehydrogenase [Pseudomonas citronellolis]